VTLITIFTAMLTAQFAPPPARPSGPWMDKSLSPDERAALLVKQLTLDEKISLVHGIGWEYLLGGPEALPARSLGGAGFIPGIPRLGIPDLQMADSAVGVTRGAIFGRYSTALPSCLSEAASWDLNVAREYGALIGRELRDQGYNMSLGGGVNIAREPRNGRNFEYRGEDPILAGKVAGAEMRALQEQGVIGDIKHFAVNDQENGRNFVEARIGKRALHESDLLAFEIAVKESGAGAVMCSYNLVNGDYACENSYLLTDVLKKSWGFPGFVLSDWGGTHSTIKAANAGLDIEMPTDTYFGVALKKEVERGGVSTARLDDMVRRVLRSEFAAGLFDRPAERRSPDVSRGLQVAQEVAEKGSVLLKNSSLQLPLPATLRSIAVIGSHADRGVLSGGGSAQVDPPGGNAVPPTPGSPRQVFGDIVWYPSSPLKAIRAKAPNARVEFDEGADPASAAKLAGGADVAIVFVNQPSSEGADMSTLLLPGNQDAIVTAVAHANPHTVVVLETGGAVLMPWITQVSAVLEAWFPGIRGGEAIANILFGDVNPSGRLPISFPRSEADLPRSKTVEQPPAREGDMVPFIPNSTFLVNARRFDVSYDEGIRVGYKWHESEGKPALFGFGFGVSYTTFSYSNLNTGSASVSFDVKNTGSRAGSETAQIYVVLPPAAKEPFRRLLAWEKVALSAGQAKTVTLTLDPHYLSIFTADREAWELLPGNYTVYVAASSIDPGLRATVRIGSMQ